MRMGDVGKLSKYYMQWVCGSMELKINVRKNKVLMIKKDKMGSCDEMKVNGEEMQEVDKFNYLGIMIRSSAFLVIKLHLNSLALRNPASVTKRFPDTPVHPL